MDGVNSVVVTEVVLLLWQKGEDFCHLILLERPPVVRDDAGMSGAVLGHKPAKPATLPRVNNTTHIITRLTGRTTVKRLKRGKGDKTKGRK